MEFYKLPLSRLVLYLCSLIISNEYDTVIFYGLAFVYSNE